MDSVLQHISTLLPQVGLSLEGTPDDPSQQGAFLDCIDTATKMKVLIGIGPGPSVLMTALLPAPPLPDSELATMSARLQMRVPHARVHLRKAPDGRIVTFLDDAHLFDPKAAPLDAAWVRGGVDALVRGARALQLLEPAIEDSSAILMGFSADDAKHQARVKELMTAQGLAMEDEADVLGGPALLVGSEEGPPTRVMVRDGTLLFHVAIPLEAPPEVRADVAMSVHRRLPFGRILLGPIDGQNAIVEYPYRLRAGELGEYDALHGFEILGAISDVLVDMFGDGGEDLAEGGDGADDESTKPSA